MMLETRAGIFENLVEPTPPVRIAISDGTMEPERLLPIALGMYHAREIGVTDAPHVHVCKKSLHGANIKSLEEHGVKREIRMVTPESAGRGALDTMLDEEKILTVTIDARGYRLNIPPSKMVNGRYVRPQLTKFQDFILDTSYLASNIVILTNGTESNDVRKLLGREGLPASSWWWMPSHPMIKKIGIRSFWEFPKEE